MGLKGIVSKRLDRAYGAGKCAHWVKIKNPRTRRTVASGTNSFRHRDRVFREEGF
jgi:ATP-dependent DNA ligase